MALSKEDILGFSNADAVKVKAFGGEVLIKPMSGKARDSFEVGITTNDTNIRARMIANTVVDDKGKLLFTEQDIIALGDKDVVELDKLFTAARKTSGFSNADIDDLAKN